MKRTLPIQRDRRVGRSQPSGIQPQEYAYTMGKSRGMGVGGVEPQEERSSCPCGLLNPSHPAHRPLHSLQVPNFDMGWMSPHVVLKPYVGTLSSPPAKMDASKLLTFHQ